jgi:hypothetical protein
MVGNGQARPIGMWSVEYGRAPAALTTRPLKSDRPAVRSRSSIDSA